MLHTVAMFLLTYTMVALVPAVGLSTTPRPLRDIRAERGLVLRALLVLEPGASPPRSVIRRGGTHPRAEAGHHQRAGAPDAVPRAPDR